jgi:AraC-like DNA-binding protein
MLRRLTELFFIKIIRVWMGQQQHDSPGWLGALKDQAISDALGLMHESPAHKWTVQNLAESVALSRSAFSARFTELVGEPPMTYLTRWRMLKAAQMLKNKADVGAIAESLGYESEAAFRKAFKREVGMPPAQYRKHG